MKRWLYLFMVVLIGGVCLIAVSCTGKSPVVQSSADALMLPEFPLSPGTTWVYTYIPYEPLESNPKQIVTATYVLTETVVETVAEAPYLFVRMRRDASLASSTPLTDATLPAGEFWYVISGTLVFEEFQVPDAKTFDPVASRLDYAFPLADGKQWCPWQIDPKNPDKPEVVYCEANGLRTAVAIGAYETPAGSFTECYQISEAFLSGGVIRQFCNGVGVVAARYDHGGTRFGFEQTLVSYTVPVP
ncbi:MAG: hypothetical protein WHX52_10475 [Anaerolineae bacterium]